MILTTVFVNEAAFFHVQSGFPCGQVHSSNRTIQMAGHSPLIRIHRIICYPASARQDHNGLQDFFSSRNPELETFLALEDSYTQPDYFLIALHTEEDDLFYHRHLQAIVVLTEASWQAPYSIQVESMSDFQHTTADQDADAFL